LREPSTSGDSKRAFPLPDRLDEKGTKAMWRLVAELKVREQTLYNRFASESFLGALVVDLIAERDFDVSWSELVEDLERFVDESSTWLVAIPLANAIVDGYVEVTEDVGLAETLQDPHWERDSEPPVDRMTLFRHLDDHIDLGARWHRPDSRGGPLDGRRTAVLVMVEQGAEPYAVSVARTKARYALAMWCLLVPPEWRQLWPTLADWEPRPYLGRGIVRKVYEPGAWAAGRSEVKGSAITEYGEYDLPRKPELLQAPFEAMARASENRLSARAALSAASSLYSASRLPSDLEYTDRLVHISAAIDALCDLGEGPTGETTSRWARITERYGICELRGPYLQGEIEEAKALARNLRNIATHGSDDTLINLGYPPELVRALSDGRERIGGELGLAQAAAVLPIISTAVRLTARRVALQGIESGWDDEKFRANFEKAGS
jgi:hypothetical protein